MDKIIIGLIVHNHMGVMSHIAGLFSRRAFNLEGILCGQIEDGTRSQIYLLVKNDIRIKQIIKQLEKLYDVIDVSICENYDQTLFDRLHEFNNR